MKRIITLILCVQLAAAAGCARSMPSQPARGGQGLEAYAKKDGTLRILYWNLQLGMWSDQRNNYDNFVAFVKALDPDICVWTEAGTGVTDEGQKIPKDGFRYLPDGWKQLARRYGHQRVYQGIKRNQMLQVMTSRTPIQNKLKMEGNDDLVIVNGANWACINPDGHPINVVSLHLWVQNYEYMAEDKEASAAAHEGDRHRESEVKYICEHTINSMPEKGDGQYWIMLGDFNAKTSLDNEFFSLPPDSPEYLAHDYIHRNTSYIDMMDRNRDSQGMLLEGYPSGRKRDFVYCNPDLAAHVSAVRLVKSPWLKKRKEKIEGRNLTLWHPSDHTPVIVDINFNK